MISSFICWKKIAYLLILIFLIQIRTKTKSSNRTNDKTNSLLENSDNINSITKDETNSNNDDVSLDNNINKESKSSEIKVDNKNGQNFDNNNIIESTITESNELSLKKYAKDCFQMLFHFL